MAVDLSSERLRADDGAHLRWLAGAVGPVLPSIRPGGLVVLPAELVRAVLTDPDRYSSSIMAGADTRLLGADGAAHRRVRRILVRALRTAEPSSVQMRSAARSARLLHAFAGTGGGDAAARVARPLARLAAADVLGLPVPAMARLGRWAAAAVGTATGVPDAAIGALSTEATAAVARALRADGRRRGLLDVLRRQLGAGELDLDGAVQVALLTLLAALDTTAALVTSCLDELARRPGPRDPAELVDRVLRTRGPVRFVRRRATGAHELGGVAVTEGRSVLAHLRGAHPDDDAGLAFGAGPHACPGASIARAVATGAVTAAAPYRLTPTGEPTLDASAQIAGYALLPLGVPDVREDLP
jgi:cytochrome P450